MASATNCGRTADAFFTIFLQSSSYLNCDFTDRHFIPHFTRIKIFEICNRSVYWSFYWSWNRKKMSKREKKGKHTRTEVETKFKCKISVINSWNDFRLLDSLTASMENYARSILFVVRSTTVFFKVARSRWPDLTVPDGRSAGIKTSWESGHSHLRGNT